MLTKLVIMLPDEDGVEREREIKYVSDSIIIEEGLKHSDFKKYGWVRNPKNTGWCCPEDRYN
jgi:hypothetical protein